MKFDFTGKALSIKRGSNEHFRQLDRSAPLDLNKDVLFNDVGHLLLLLLTLVDLLLEVRDLL